MSDSSLQEYLEKNISVHNLWRKIFLGIVGTLILILAVIGLVLPLRPAYSAQEKRPLAEFPDPTLDGVLEGEWFSDIVVWYSDTYPLRERMIAINSKVEEGFGFRTTAIYGNVPAAQADEIPDASDLDIAPLITTTPAPGTEAAESVDMVGTSAELPEAEKEESGEESVTSSSVSDADRPDASEEEKPADAGEEGAPAEETEEETPAGENLPDGTIHDLPEVIGTVYITGNRGFDIYYFSQDNADAYASMLNTVRARLSPDVNVYDMIIPTSFGVCLDQNVQESLGGSYQGDAIAYMYSRITDDVKKVFLFDELVKHNAEYIYYQTDHHWSALGAYYAYRQFCEVKGVTPHELSEFQEMQFPGFLGTYYNYSNQAQALANNPDTVHAWIPMGTNTMTYTDVNGNTVDYPIVADATEFHSANKYLCFIAGDQPYERIENPAVTDGSSAVVIKESFGNALVPFLVDHYQYIHVIDYRYYYGDLTQFCIDHNINDVIFANNTEAVGIERANIMMSLFPEH